MIDENNEQIYFFPCTECTDKICTISYSNDCYDLPEFLNSLLEPVTLSNYTVVLKENIPYRLHDSDFVKTVSDDYLRIHYQNAKLDNIVDKVAENEFEKSKTRTDYFGFLKRVLKLLSIPVFFLAILVSLMLSKLLLVQIVSKQRYKNRHDTFFLNGFINQLLLFSEIPTLLFSTYTVIFKKDNQRFSEKVFVKVIIPELCDVVGQVLFVWLVIPNTSQVVSICAMSCMFMLNSSLNIMNRTNSFFKTIVRKSDAQLKIFEYWSLVVGTGLQYFLFVLLIASLIFVIGDIGGLFVVCLVLMLIMRRQRTTAGSQSGVSG